MRLEFQVNIRSGYFLPGAKLPGISDFLTDPGPITFTLPKLCPPRTLLLLPSPAIQLLLNYYWDTRPTPAYHPANNLQRNFGSLFIIPDGFTTIELRARRCRRLVAVAP